MSVWFVSGGRSFDAALGTALGASFVSEVDFNSQLLDYIVTCRAEPVALVLVVDIYSHRCIRRLITCLRRSRASCSDLSKLKVIILSTFDTWGGRWPKHSILDIDTSFRSRLPLASAYALYDLENELAVAAERCGVPLRIVGCGLLYGGDGLDLKELLLTLWRGVAEASNGNSNTFVPPCQKDAVVPIIGMSNFLSLVKRLTSEAEWGGHAFVPAVDSPILEDGAVLSFAEVFGRFAAVVDGSTGVSPIASLQGDCGPPGSSSAWKIHVPFAAGPVVGNLLTDARQVWAEFLQSNALQPISIILAGPPRIGKSDIARVLADRLEIEAVTLESAVHFLLKTKHGVDVPPGVAQLVTEAYAELKAAVDAKAAEGKKPSKGSHAAAEEAPIDEAVFTPAFCQALPVGLLRRCVSAQVNLQPRCRRRGFVLDVWDGKVVTGLDTLEGALRSVWLQPGARPDGVDLAVELHCPATLPTERLVAAQGPQAKSKEAQAAVKALETQLAAYQATLCALPTDDGAGAGLPAHMTSGSMGVVDILESASNSGQGCFVCRIDCSAPQSASLEGAVSEVFTSVLKMREGRIGWLSPTNWTNWKTSAVDESTAACKTKSTGDNIASTPLIESSGASDTGPVLHPAETSGLFFGLDAAKKSALIIRSSKLEAFLTANVLPQVAKGLVQIRREQPDDPILFLAEHLLQQSAGATTKAQEAARQRFSELLRLGGF